ncbi:hypothetical protein WA158_004904 [Blastocystis sp. Blastoise]
MPKETRTRTSAYNAGAAPTGAGGGLGQHFLKNVAVVQNIVSKAGIKPTDTVLEIGPGNGIMTIELLRLAKKVIAVELDPRMVAEVQKRVQGTEYAANLKIIHGDILKVELPYFDVCVANVPYQVSSGIVFKLLGHRPFFRCAVLMFQEEFAQRLSAKPNDAMYCRLSVNTQLLSRVQQVLKVSKKNFNPPPKVESRVVRIEPLNPPPPVNFPEWDGFIRLCFERKNKTLGAIFRQKKLVAQLKENYVTFCTLNNKIPDERDMKQVIEEVLTSTNFSEQRASKMSLDDFLTLLNAFLDRDIHFA